MLSDWLPRCSVGRCSGPALNQGTYGGEPAAVRISAFRATPSQGDGSDVAQQDCRHKAKLGMAMLRLADTSIRMYRRKDGRVSLRLRSYLMVKTSATFRLAAYLRAISCELNLPSGESIVFDEVGYADRTWCEYEIATMVHEFWASAVSDMPRLEDRVGTLRVDYQFSFTGHPYEKPGFFEVVVPLIKRKTHHAP